jgi:hypothetical protein
MKSLLQLSILAGALAPLSATALETSVNSGPQAAQAAVSSINTTVNGGLAALQAEINLANACGAQPRFYAPSDPLHDANGCLGVGDYPLAMNNTSYITTNNGNIAVTAKWKPTGQLQAPV